MINHARTLLLNRDGDKRPDPMYFLEEYVDPEFKALALPSFLAAYSQALIDPASDNAYANYKLRQYMYILHTTEFSSYVFNLDPRVTYLTNRSIVQNQNDASYQAMNVLADNISLYFIGEAAAVSSGTKLFRSWEAEILTPLVVRTTSLQDGSVVDTVVTVDASMSSEVRLAGQNNFSFRIAASPLPVGAKWIIQAFARPEGDLTDMVAQLNMLTSGSGSFLFPNVEPFKTFGELWNKHNQLPYRLSGLLLAYVYQVEKVRLNA
jgi:hypothetical protein